MAPRLLTVLLIFFLWQSCTIDNDSSPMLIEFSAPDELYDHHDMLEFAREMQIDTASVYKWKNHWLILGPQDKLRNASRKLHQQMSAWRIREFVKPFYHFNRAKFTGEKPADEWVHILMTANLVEDMALQEEYMAHHDTQFDLWPEVSKGFANAQFQQVLVYRCDRQLLLLISIPKGKTLDELNPKTSENNPRVDEWNRLMEKYQEGIPDAPIGTTWIEFKPLGIRSDQAAIPSLEVTGQVWN